MNVPVKAKLLSLADLKAKVSAPKPPLVKGMIDKGSFVVLAGSSKAGKSALATHLAFSVAKGSPFLGMETAQSPVLWVTFEESPEERRLLCQPYGDEAPVFLLQEPLPIDTDDGITMLEDAIDQSQAGLVVIDPLVAAVSCDSLSESVKSRQALQPLNDLRIRKGVTVLLLHHQNKGQHSRNSPDKMSDSHQIASVCTQFWNMDYSKKNGARTIRLQGRGRHENGDRLWTIRSADVSTYELVKDEETVVKPAKLSASLTVLQSVEGGRLYTAESLATATGLNAGTVRNTMTKLVRQGTVEAVKMEGKRGSSYRLAS